MFSEHRNPMTRLALIILVVFCYISVGRSHGSSRWRYRQRNSRGQRLNCLVGQDCNICAPSRVKELSIGRRIIHVCCVDCMIPRGRILTVTVRVPFCFCPRRRHDDSKATRRPPILRRPNSRRRPGVQRYKHHRNRITTLTMRPVTTGTLYATRPAVATGSSYRNLSAVVTSSSIATQTAGMSLPSTATKTAGPNLPTVAISFFNATRPSVATRPSHSNLPVLVTSPSIATKTGCTIRPSIATKTARPNPSSVAITLFSVARPSVSTQSSHTIPPATYPVTND